MTRSQGTEIGGRTKTKLEQLDTYEIILSEIKGLTVKDVLSSIM